MFLLLLKHSVSLFFCHISVNTGTLKPPAFITVSAVTPLYLSKQSTWTAKRTHLHISSFEICMILVSALKSYWDAAHCSALLWCSYWFRSSTKFDSGTGWPSYYKPIGDNVKSKLDMSNRIHAPDWGALRCLWRPPWACLWWRATTDREEILHQ